MLPKRFEPIVHGLLLTGFMSFVVSGISAARIGGLTDDLPAQWLAAWLPSWMVAFPVVLVVGPLVRRIVVRLVRSE